MVEPLFFLGDAALSTGTPVSLSESESHANLRDKGMDGIDVPGTQKDLDGKRRLSRSHLLMYGLQITYCYGKRADAT